MEHFGVPLERVQPHQYFATNKKLCPWRILKSQKTWQEDWAAFQRRIGAGATVSPARPTVPTGPTRPFRVRVLDPALNIRKGPGIGNPVVDVIRGKGVYTIVEETRVGATPWGKLKSGAGWISLGAKYVRRV